MDLPQRLAEIDRLPLSPEGRALARLVCLLNESGAVMDEAERERVGDALACACHAAHVTTGNVRRLVNPESAAFVKSITDFMLPRD